VILGVLAVPFAHGILEYCGLIVAALLLIAVNNAVARKKETVAGFL
jgi:hypothetical protein